LMGRWNDLMGFVPPRLIPPPPSEDNPDEPKGRSRHSILYMRSLLPIVPEQVESDTITNDQGFELPLLPQKDNRNG
jgi:hypothetical protein